MQLEHSGPAIFGVPGHQQALQLLVCIGGVLVDLCKAVVDVAADLRELRADGRISWKIGLCCRF